MKSPQPQDAPQLLPASRITGIFDCIPVLVQEEPALVRRQLIQDPLRVKRILALGRLGAHSVIVTSRGWHGPRHARRASESRERSPIARVSPPAAGGVALVYVR
jgi:hypothetical protein